MNIKKYSKIILKYITIFITTVAILLLLLIVVAKIPKSAIEKNLEKSVIFYEKLDGIQKIKFNKEYSYLHYYADTVTLNIIYNIDSNNPLKSVMSDDYFQIIDADVNDNYIILIKNNKETNRQYLRYWHGNIVILRPLFTVLTVEQIYTINKVILGILAIVLFIVIFKKSKKLSIIYLISMIMITFPIVPFCFEYSWTFYLMFIISLIAIKVEKKGDNSLFNLFFITGMLTCFFDFLTTEITLFLSSSVKP